MNPPDRVLIIRPASLQGRDVRMWGYFDAEEGMTSSHQFECISTSAVTNRTNQLRIPMTILSIFD